MYQAYVTRIKNIRKHSNADRLMVGECFGNHVIVSLETVEDTLGIYFATDGQLGMEYAKENQLIRMKDELGNNIGGYLDPDKRNIRTLKLRGETSDGLFMPLESLSKFTDISKLKVGDTITVLDGVIICEKYIPKVKVRAENPNSKGKNKAKTISKISYPNFKEHIDTKQLRYHLAHFSEGDIINISLKMHGTSARTSNALKETKKFTHPFMIKVMELMNIKNPIETSYDYVTGTRRVVLKDFSGGYYGSNTFRLAYHDDLKGKLMKGESLYYEIVGYQSDEKLIMSTCNNKKVGDKEFVKKYGKLTEFTYGCEKGKSDIYAYRMNVTNEDGFVVEYSPAQLAIRCEQMGIKVCPTFENFVYTTSEDLMERVSKYLDIEDPIGKTHINEGVVVRVVNRENFSVYKEKGFYFKCIEGIIKENATEPDMEEAQE